MKLKIFFSFILISIFIFIFILCWQPFWLKFKFGCGLVDNGTYLVWLKCNNLENLDVGVVDYKFVGDELIVKRYVVDNFNDERFYYCQEVEFYVYKKNDVIKYNNIEFLNVSKKYGLGKDFLSIDDRYLKYSNSDVDKEKCEMLSSEKRNLLKAP